MKLNELPSLGKPLDGGTFAGLTTRADGTHCAVVLLPGLGENLTWTKAKAWAKKRGGELPTCPVAALLYANVKPALTPRWHWTADEYDASFALYCNFINCGQGFNRKSYDGCAVAVRLIPLTV
jgi:hypothetical protein